MSKEKKSKVLNMVINIVCIVIMVFVLTLTISTLSAPKGMSSFLGYGYLTVKSESMAGSESDSFKTGDVIYVDILTEKEKASLKEGDIVTFLDNIGGEIAYNSHRIIDIKVNTDGSLLYTTKGDANELKDSFVKEQSDIVARYVDKSQGIGKAILWMQSPNGFIFCVVIPGILIALYTVYVVVTSVKEFTKARKASEQEVLRDSMTLELKEQLRQELLKEMENKEK